MLALETTVIPRKNKNTLVTNFMITKNQMNAKGGLTDLLYTMRDCRHT